MSSKSSTKSAIYEFGEFKLNTALAELHQGQSVVEVQKRVLSLLVFLVENRTRTVTKDELQDAVWPGVVVSETALTRAVMKARRAVGDSAEEQALIKTVHGQGYRFVAQVSPREGVAVDRLAAEIAGELRRKERRNSLLRVATTYGAGTWLLNQVAAMVWEAFEWQKLPLQVLLAISLIGFPIALIVTWFYQPTAQGLKLRREQPVQPATHSRRRDLVVMGMLAAALAFSLAVNFGTPEITPVHEQVAVLPVNNLTQDASLDWVDLGMLALLKSQLDSEAIPTVTVNKVLQHIGSDFTQIGQELVATLRKAEGATILVHPQLHQASAGFKATGSLFNRGEQSQLPEFVAPTPSEAIRKLGEYVVRFVKPQERSLGEALGKAATGDPFKDQAFARGMYELLQGSLPQARKLLAVAADGDSFWPNYQLALTISRLGDLDDASTRYLTLLQTAREKNNASQIVVLSNALGIVNDHKGLLDAAQAHYQEGLDWAGTKDQAVPRAHLWINYAILERTRSKTQLAQEYLGRAASAYKEAGIEILPGDFYITLGNLAADSGDLREAQRQYQQALTNFRRLNQPKGEGIALSNLSWASEMLGEFGAAEDYLSESARIRADIGDNVGRVKSMVRQASLAYSQGKLDAAEQYSLALLDEPYVQQEQNLLASALNVLGHIARHRRQWPAALERFEEALTIEETGGRAYGQLAARAGLMETHFDAGNEDLARTIAQELIEDPLATELVRFRFEAKGLLAKILVQQSQPDKAIAMLRETIRQADTSGADGIRARLCADLADVYLDNGKIGEAEGWIGTALGSAPHNGRVRLAQAKLEFEKKNSAEATTLVSQAVALQGQRIEPLAKALLARYTPK